MVKKEEKNIGACVDDTWVRVTEAAGFCYGVERAVRLAAETAEKHGGAASLGAIIHNETVVDELAEKGLRVIETLDGLKPNEPLIIRSHGVGRGVYAEIEARGLTFTDATCPTVSKIHRIVREKSAEGCEIIIIGDKNHPEVNGIMGHCGERGRIIADEAEFLSFFLKEPNFLKKKVAIVAQTTYNKRMWDGCIEVLRQHLEMEKISENSAAKNADIQIFDTLCKVTSLRQEQADELSRAADIMLVIGSEKSSNTRKLFDICKDNCAETYFIADAGGLGGIPLTGAAKIGVTAGASTPAHIIKEVQNKMAENFNVYEEDVNFVEALEQSFKKIHMGEKVKGIVVAVNNSEAIVDIGTKHTGYIPSSELTHEAGKKPNELLTVGDELELIVIRINDVEGMVTLSKKKVEERASYDKIFKDREENEVFTGTVQNIVKGGVLVGYDGIKVFVPSSQTGIPKDGKLDVLLRQKVKFTVIEVNEQRNRVIGSISAVNKAQREEAKAKFWADAEEGKVYKGEVKSLTSYGAFVDLGGIDGMVHVSELSWGRTKHPGEIVKVGDVLEVFIKQLDRETNRISLGYKKPGDDPWLGFPEKYNVGDALKGKIVSITPFGAFAELMPGIDGLIHISQISDKRVEHVKDALKIGQEVDVKILEINPEKKRISISMRALIEDEAIDNAGENESVYDTDKLEVPVAETAVEDVSAEETVAEEVVAQEIPVETAAE